MAPLNCSTVGSSMMLVGSASQSLRVLGKKLSVAVGTRAESHESVFLLSCCANSWSDVVWDWYCYLMVDGFVKHG